GVEGGDHLARRAQALRDIEMDRAAARLRLEALEEEARGDGIAGERLVDDDAGEGRVLALAQRLLQARCTVARAGLLPGGIARGSRQKAPVGAPGDAKLAAIHDPPFAR